MLRWNTWKNRFFGRLALRSRAGLRRSRRRSNQRDSQLGAAAACETLEDRVLLSRIGFGDFNGDGYLDRAVGNPGAAVNSKGGAGNVRVSYGAAVGSDPPYADQIWSQDSKGIKGKAESRDNFGQTVVVGDFNGDGYDDLAIGVWHEGIGGILGELNSAGEGAVNVIYGSRYGLDADSAVKNQIWTQKNAGFGTAENSTDFLDFFGMSMTVGDFNGDGVDDLAIGSPGEDQGLFGRLDNAGGVHILYGLKTYGLTNPGPNPYGNLKGYSAQHFDQDSKGIKGSVEDDDHFGDTLAAGDFNGDGRDDLVVGVPGDGVVNVIYGSPGGLTASGDQIWRSNTSSVPFVDGFTSILAIGDFNKDGYEDLAIGAPRTDLPGIRNVGAVLVIYGSPTGLQSATTSGAVRSAQVWNQSKTGVAGSREEGNRFGRTLRAEYVNNDGYIDLIVGVNDPDIGNEIVLYGSPKRLLFGGGLSSKPPLLKNPGEPPVLKRVEQPKTPPLPFPAAPVFTSPRDGTTIVDATPKFTWTAIAGASLYEINVYNKPLGQLLYNRFLATPSFTPPADLPTNTIIQAFVRAIDANGAPGIFSGALEFDVSANSLSPNGTPFQWTPVVGATSYDVLAYDVAAGQQAFDLKAVTGTSIDLSTEVAAPGKYQVFVRPVGGQWSAPTIVQVDNVFSAPGKQLVPAAPALNLYVSEANSVNVELLWTPVKDASRFELIGYDIDAGKEILHLDDLTTPYKRVPGLTPGRTYQFFVRGINGADQKGGWSAAANVTVQADAAPPAPTLTGPASPAASLTPKITWTAAARAVKYDLVVYDLTAGTSTFATVVTGTEFTPHSTLKVGTKYQAFVRGRNASGESGEWSQPLVFEVGGTQFPAPPVLNPMPLNRFDQTPTISWSPIKGAIGFDVLLYNKATGKEVANTRVISGTSFTPSSPLPAGDYQIFVRAVSLGGQTGFWSDPGEFRVNVQVAQPVPPSPPTGPILATGPVAQLLDAVFITLQ